MRLKEIIEKKGMMAKDLGAKVGLDAGNISRILNYRMLPIPATLNKICEVLGVEPLDIYTRDEVTLVPPLKGKTTRHTDGTARGYNLCIMIPEKYRDKLSGWIKELGYATFGEWLEPYLKETEEKINDRHQ